MILLWIARVKENIITITCYLFSSVNGTTRKLKLMYVA